jgi:hypothetical protein
LLVHSLIPRGSGRSFASALEETTEAPSRKDGHLNLVDQFKANRASSPNGIWMRKMP